ncbi:amino acid adenylation domain-containing protein, partial [Microbulbifer epialgicus]
MSNSRIEDLLPLSPLQHGFLFHALYDREVQDSYVVQMVFSLRGPLDTSALKAAAQAVLQRHASLRAGFVHHKIKEPVQVIQRSVEVPWRLLDLSGLEPGARLHGLQETIGRDREQRFDLTKAPLLRFALVRVSPVEHYLLFTSHHILLDGWSSPLLLQELFTLYHNGCDVASLPPVTPYRDYMHWLTSRDVEAARTAWRQAFADFSEPSRIAVAVTAPAVPETLRLNLPDSLAAALNGEARRLGATINTMIQAVWGLLLGSLTHRDDVVFGSTVSGRPPELPGVERMVGLFINTIPVRLRLRPEETFEELILRLQAQQSALLDHQHLGLSEIQRITGSGELFDTLVVFENFPVGNGDESTDNETLQVELHSHHGGDTSHYPVGLALIPGRPYQLKLSYRPDVFDRAAIERLGRRYQRLLETLVYQPQQRVAHVQLLDERELTQLCQWNNTTQSVLPTLLPEGLARRAQAAPDATAVVFEGELLSYGELEARANRLAHSLIANGIGPESIVGVALPRSLDLVVALCAVLKAGAAYLPLDIGYPADRIADMIEDASPECILTHGNLAGRLSSRTPLLELDDANFCRRLAQAPAASPTDVTRLCPLRATHPAYVIYTSGSTGKPKGAIISHGAIANRLAWMQAEYELAPDDAVLQKTPVSFDVSVWEVFWPLLQGARLVVARPDGHRDPAYLARLIVSEQITTVHFVASMLEMFVEELDATNCTGLRRIICGGEALSVDLQQRVSAQIDGQLYHSYGPTETAIGVTGWLCGNAETDRVPIGGPIWNTRLYVLDSALRPVPAGVTGELYIAGRSLARGYLKRPALTTERFVADPFGRGERMYRSGDLASWREDGVIIHRGRADQQVKVRGFRIELGEIEAEIARAGFVRNAVLLREDQPGQQQLVAYVVGSCERESLEARLVERLPEYMVPAAIVSLDALPLLPNGKLDRRALPTPGFSPTNTRGPRTPQEETLCKLFAEVLGQQRVGIDDSFFALGGHSLLAIRLISRIRSELDVELPIRALFEAPTVAALVRAFDPVQTRRPALQPMPRPDALPLSFAQRRLWFLHQLEGPSPTYNLPLALRLQGPLDVDALSAALTDLCDRHESLRTIFPPGDSPVQQVLDRAEPKVQLVGCDESELVGALAQAAAHAFDLGSEIPLRVTLFRLGAEDHALMVLLHHIAGDGASLAPLARDLASAYSARLAGKAPDWEPLPVQYADFTLWQQALLGEENDPASLLAHQIDYWRETLADLPEQISLPADRPRPIRASHRGGQHTCLLEADVHRRLCAIAERRGTTLFMVLQGALAGTLTRLGAGTDIAIGSPLAGRTDSALADLVGLFLNTLVLRTDTSGNPHFHELLARVREADLGAYENQDLPFEQLVELLSPARSLSHHPLFQVLMVLQNTESAQFCLPGLDCREVQFGMDVAKFDLSFAFAERTGADGSADGLDIALEYASDLFDAATAERIMRYLVRMLVQIAEDDTIRIGAVELLDGHERQRLLLQYNDTAYPVPVESLAASFAAQVAATPDAVAITDEQGAELSYTELDRRANRLAQVLRQRGAGSECGVGLLLHRSADLVVAILATVKTGAYYVPLHHQYPDERLAQVLAETRAPILVADTSLDGRALVHANVLRLDALDSEHDSDFAQVQRAIYPEQLAYVMFTSGSTGMPKGVAVGQRDIVEFVRDRRFSQEPQVVLLHSPHAFDASTYELWVPLLNGGRVVIAPPGQNSGDELRRIVETHNVHSLWLTAGLFHEFVESTPDLFAGLRQVYAGGDVLAVEAVRKLQLSYPELRIVNGYGPTETTTFALTSAVPPLSADASTVPIGRPLDNMQAYVLDETLQPVPVGVAGELYIAGAGLARGYLGRPGLTAERFVANPFEPGVRMYRSGDLVRWRHNGEIDYLG